MSDPIYLVNPVTNQPIRISPVSFGSLNVKERQNLEEWVLKHPEILGEPLLVLTTEFDRFDKSSMRLDVLALDRDGVLVVIELKLDIANSLADQQAIRYAAFCSTMTMSQAVQQLAAYLGCDEPDAEARVRDFLHSDELPQLDNHPRIILAAGSMDDSELTSCVLWLRSFGVDISCVELTPYRLPEATDVLMVPRVIIPLPEARDFVISVEQKEVTKVQEAKAKGAYSQLWSIVAEEYLALNPKLTKLGNDHYHYLQIRVGGKAMHYEWIVQKQKSQVDVAIHFESGDLDENVRRLALVQAHEDDIKAGVTAPFHANRWGRKWASLGFSVPYSGIPNRETAKRCATLMKLLVDRTYDSIQNIIKGPIEQPLPAEKNR
jgi:hypothetical protein